MKERLAKWMIRKGAALLGRGYIETLRGDISIPNGDFSITIYGPAGGGGSGHPKGAQGGNGKPDPTIPGGGGGEGTLNGYEGTQIGYGNEPT